MLKILKGQNRFNETLFMGIMSIVCFGLSIFRFFYTDSKQFIFLNWNLFLAFIPWALSSLVVLKPNILNNKIIIAVLLLIWVLFFPNAPYILTDLFHLRVESSMPIWFDLVLILSFAWTGLLFGFLSLWDIEKVLKEKMNPFFITVISISFLFLGSFGVYIGRYLRWNSWDVINEPFGLLYDIGNRVVHPYKHPTTWGMTIFLGIFLNLLYWSFRLIKSKR